MPEGSQPFSPFREALLFEGRANLPPPLRPGSWICPVEFS